MQFVGVAHKRPSMSVYIFMWQPFFLPSIFYLAGRRSQKNGCRTKLLLELLANDRQYGGMILGRRKNTDNQGAGASLDQPVVLQSGGRVRRAFRIFTATVIVVLLAGGFIAAGIFFLISGEAGKDSLLHSSLQSALQKVVGPDFHVELGETNQALVHVAGKSKF